MNFLRNLFTRKVSQSKVSQSKVDVIHISPKSTQPTQPTQPHNCSLKKFKQLRKENNVESDTQYPTNAFVVKVKLMNDLHNHKKKIS
jgi:hypothetical protein